MNVKAHIFADNDMKIRLIIAVTYTTQAIVKLKPENNSGLNGIGTHDLCDTDAVLYKWDFNHGYGGGRGGGGASIG